MLLLQDSETEISPELQTFLVFLVLIGLASIVISRLYVFFEQVYASWFKRPFFVHIPFFEREITSEQKTILSKEFDFYNKLEAKQKKRFEHRLANYLRNKRFVGREGFEISEEVQVLISATAVMLTFGFRNYMLPMVETILVYPSVFYSTTNETYHKGEFNPMLRIMALSWEHFVDGYDISNDNINLGIHEFAHVIHLSSLKSNDISSIIFAENFKEMTDFLSKNQVLRERLIASEYFRDYAYTNQFEFVAVIIETFIETPADFRQQFPMLYKKTRQMLNFNFAGY